MKPKLWRRLALTLLVCWAAIGFSRDGVAVTYDLTQIEALDGGDDGLRILLMPLDVELSSLQASGMTEPKAEWTETAKALMLTEMRGQFSSRGGEMVEYAADEDAARADSDEARVVKLHRAVGMTILNTKIGVDALPTKKKVFDWTLGPKVASLRDKYQADYALFTYVRDSYTSTGRMVAMFAAMALWGGYLDGGSQKGFVSLVDLRTGNVVWFNYLPPDPFGDLRNQEGAQKTVSRLMDKMPK